MNNFVDFIYLTIDNIIYRLGKLIKLFTQDYASLHIDTDFQERLHNIEQRIGNKYVRNKTFTKVS